jgi:hypothetical protein
MGILVKAKDGTGDKKTQDYLHYVGKVQLTRIPILGISVSSKKSFGTKLIENVPPSFAFNF